MCEVTIARKGPFKRQGGMGNFFLTESFIFRCLKALYEFSFSALQGIPLCLLSMCKIFFSSATALWDS